VAVANRTPEGGRLATVSAALLVGGASSRMGRDKAGIRFDGVPAATRLSTLLAGLFEEVLLVGGEPPPDSVGRRIADCEGPRCALRGIVSALAAASNERVLVLATDLPLVTPDLLLALVAWPEADAVLPRDAAGRHPLCALYRRDPLLARARARLGDGRLKLDGLLDEVETSHLEASDLRRVDPAGSALTNVNDPDDLARAAALLSARRR
jgi:molybdopterin-guanine dinucleotide biosynthesis protein A